MEKTKFNIRTIIEDSVSTFKPKADEKKLLMYPFVNSNVPEKLMGDPARLRQILNNLLGNAIKFTSHGEISLKLEMVEDADNIATVYFEITDTGIGISEEASEDLFKPYIQVSSLITKEFGGTGLGLAICKELVNMMEGDIGVKSLPGKGATFFFTAKFEIVSKTNEIIVENYKRLNRLRVLIVCCDNYLRKITRNYLEEFGIQVLEAEGEEHGIRELQKYANGDNTVDIVITDYELSDMSGYEFASAIRKLPSIRNTWIILLTSVSQEADEIKGKKGGVDEYLSKPIHRDKLLDSIMIAEGIKQDVKYEEGVERKINENEVAVSWMPEILLVEDNIINRKVAIEMLKNGGLSCDVAINGKEAYELCSRKDYDIVFMDCQMPVMDGYESTAKIREMEGDKKHTTIIAMTAYAMEGDRKKCIDGGMDDYISKPLNFNIVFKVIEEYRKKRKMNHFDLIDDNIDRFVNDTGFEKDVAMEIFLEYARTLPDHLYEIEEALNNMDFEKLGKLIHQLKGTSGNLRVTSIYELAATLEGLALKKDKEKCRNVVLEMRKVINI